MQSDDEYNRDLKALMATSHFSDGDRDAVAFLLACVYVGPHPRKIAQVAKLKRVVVRRFLEIAAEYLCDPKHRLVMQWPDEKYGDISFILDVLVVQGKVSRRWDETEEQFYWQVIPDSEQLPPPTEKPRAPYRKREPKYAVEIKLSARREGLVPIKQ